MDHARIVVEPDAPQNNFPVLFISSELRQVLRTALAKAQGYSLCMSGDRNFALREVHAFFKRASRYSLFSNMAIWM